MCKLIAMNQLSCKSLKQASQIVRKSAELLGSSQRDGFGYALHSQNGVFIERYLRPETCKGISVLKDSRDALPANIRTQLSYGIDYDQKGNKPENGQILGSYIAHGRTATCGKTITNTHPFHGVSDSGEWTIAHNGVVDWDGEKYPLQTSCDSEHILNTYLYANGEQSFKDGLSGYAAVVGISPEGEMFCLRDDRAPLYLSYIKEISQYVVCTDSTHCAEIIKMLINFNDLKASTVTTPMLLAPYVRHTFRKSGEVDSVEFTKFSSYSKNIGYGSVSRSLGSAGTPGYGSYGSSYSYGDNYSSSYWDDQVSNIPTNPAELDEVRKQRLRQHRSNSNKPWKHNSGDNK